MGMNRLDMTSPQELRDGSCSRRWLIALFVLTCVTMATLIPSMQSPDEFDHVKRAYLLGKGAFTLQASADQGSGGMVDTGLLSYFNAYGVLPYRPHRKLSLEESFAAETARWTGQREFSAAPGTGYYLPAIYIPQALGLMVGEATGLTIGASYDLAVLLTILSCGLLLWAAFWIYPVNPAVLALLILPMSLFQFASSTIDGLSMALTVLSVSLFLRIAQDRRAAAAWLMPALTLALIVLIGSRVHMLPALLMLAMACFYVRTKSSYYLFILAIAIIAAWLLHAMGSTVDKRVLIGASTAEVGLHYLKHPVDFLRVLGATLKRPDLREFYTHSFIGVLGWLDASFRPEVYRLALLALAAIGILSLSFRRLRMDWPSRAALLLCAVASVFMTFLALLVTWNKHPADVVLGVQGRYFALPMILLAYALGASKGAFEGLARKGAAVVLVALMYLSITATVSLMLGRYYQSFAPIESVSVSVSPTPPLSPANPLRVSMSFRYLADQREISRLGINFGTHMRTNRGEAELQLLTPAGETVRVPIALPELKDNEYALLDVPQGRYVSGRIVSITGGGVSVWQATPAGGGPATCMVYVYVDGSSQFTEGCPTP
ncbi:DUF2142 domain-containing protein [Achromobacter denitrificans]|nr:DUF2142 domain-containing protein [Achromobacter denitrificans]